MRPPRSKKPHGQVRQSQVITTYGPGSLVDLPKHSVLVGGLDGWTDGGALVEEPRLVAKLKRLVGVDSLLLKTPPPDPQDPTAPPTGITVYQFPEWFIAQEPADGVPRSPIRSRALVHRSRLTSRRQYIDEDRRKLPVVPVRFVRACRRGHIGDIDWIAFVHNGGKESHGELRMEERGTSGDLAETFVRCPCNAERSLSQAARLSESALGHCDGSRPWLGAFTKETCGEPSRLLVRHATHAWFPQKLSVISLPDRDEALVRAVTDVWEHHLQYVESVDELRRERERKPPIRVALTGFTDEQVFKEIDRRRTGAILLAEKSVKEAEAEVLTAAAESMGEDRPDGDYYARALPRAKWDSPWMQAIQQVVLVQRLREVVACAGFTRFEPATADLEGELDLGARPASLAREVRWLPAVENRGEGIFLHFRQEAIEAWLTRPRVIERGVKLNEGFGKWKQEHPGSKRTFFGLAYTMLHSLSHLVITAVALECGYPASSLRERIYALSAGHGVLIYTASSDAEGTLGGLIEVGRRIREHVRGALEAGSLCSNDPVCAQHDPQDRHERRFLQGAACHGCLLIAETSCEQHNDYLDRALVIPTVAGDEAEFFSPEGT